MYHILQCVLQPWQIKHNHHYVRILLAIKKATYKWAARFVKLIIFAELPEPIKYKN